MAVKVGGDGSGGQVPQPPAPGPGAGKGRGRPREAQVGTSPRNLGQGYGATSPRAQPAGTGTQKRGPAPGVERAGGITATGASSVSNQGSAGGGSGSLAVGAGAGAGGAGVGHGWMGAGPQSGACDAFDGATGAAGELAKQGGSRSTSPQADAARPTTRRGPGDGNAQLSSAAAGSSRAGAATITGDDPSSTAAGVHATSTPTASAEHGTGAASGIGSPVTPSSSTSGPPAVVGVGIAPYQAGAAQVVGYRGIDQPWHAVLLPGGAGATGGGSTTQLQASSPSPGGHTRPKRELSPAQKMAVDGLYFLDEEVGVPFCEPQMYQ